MKKNGLIKTETDAANEVVYWLSRPWALGLALAFVLTPASKLLHALDAGADFLNIGPGVRAAGMGSAYTAFADDAGAIYYNPAGLAGARREVSVMHADWALGGAFDFGAAAFPLRQWTAAVSFTRLNHGALEARGAGREALAGFGASDKAFGVGLGKAVGGGLSLGLGAKWLSSIIAGYEASTFAVDFGLVKRLAALPARLGLAVRNIGPGLKFLEKRDSLPLAVSAGAAVRLAAPVNLVIDLSRLVRDGRSTLSVGTEYGLAGAMALRGGYSSSVSGGSSLGGFSGGVGLKLGGVRMDYSFSPFGDFETTKKFSLGYKF